MRLLISGLVPIDLSDLAAGQYTVELNNGNRSFIIKK